MSERLTKDKIIEQQTYILATYMMFIAVNNLIEEFQEFTELFDDFMSKGLGTNGDTLEQDFTRYLEERKGETRNA